MAFNDKELQIIKWGQSNGKSAQDIKQAVVNFRVSGSPTPQVKPTTPAEAKPSLLSRAVSRSGEIFEEGRQQIAQETGEAGSQIAEMPNTALSTFIEKPLTMIRSIFRGAGTALKTAGKLIAAPIATAVNAISEKISDIPEVQKFAQNPFVGSALDTVIGGLQQAGENYDEFKQKNPQLAQDIEAGTEILLTVLGEKPTQEILSRVYGKVKGGASFVADVADDGIKSLKQTTEALVEKLPSITTPEKLSTIPSRIKTNLQQKQLVQTAIKELPTEKARTAVRQGIEINDVKELVSKPVPAGQKEISRELVDTAKAFSSNGGRGTDPMEVVGKPMVSRIKYLESEKGRIGQKLGEVAKELGTVTQKEVQPVVLAELQKVRGLNGLSVNKKGVLDFSKTVLTTAETKADRIAIQSIYTSSIKSGSGNSKHLLRQELFEILGGKKSSLSNMTGTQDSSFQAVRKALSDVLETKNSSYKDLSNQYREVVTPLGEARKLIKLTAEKGEENIDLLDLEAGILARRLTSTSISRPRIEALFRELDSVGLKQGDSTVSVKQLQDLYNILNKYYDISPTTGFQGQIKDAIGGGGVVDRIVGGVSKLAGETPAVRQKALEDLLDDLF